MKAAEEKVKTSIYLPESLHWKLKEAAVARRIKDTEAMEEAVRRWVDNPVEDPAKIPELKIKGATEDDVDLARRFLRWHKKVTSSATHKGLVDLMEFELSREK